MAEPTSTLFSRALARLRTSGALTGALSGTVLFTLPSCIDQPADATSAVESPEWAQFEGKRDLHMVSFTGEWWSECSSNNTRFGCGGTSIHLKVRVQPVKHADLGWKRVGIVYKSPDDLTERTALGTYFATHADGSEEWQVTVTVPQYQNVLAFDAWYQDGKGSTWIDDNMGELHVINPGPAYQVVRVEPFNGTVSVGAGGVQGRISLQLADLDADKELELVGSNDGWQTVQSFGMGVAGDKNKLYWAEDFPYAPGRERWHIDLDLPGSADHFEYAVVYRHGIVNGARTYEFWDNNNGANWKVDRPSVLQ